MTSTPPPLNDKFIADLSISNPLPRPKIISPATTTNPYKVDGRTEQDSNTTNDIIYEQEMRWALKESRVSLKREQNYTPDNKNHNPGASSSTYESASASTPAPTPNPTNTFDNMQKPSAHTPDDSHPSFTTPHRAWLARRWWAEEDYENQWQEPVIGPTSLTTTPKVSWVQEDYGEYQWQK